MSPVYTPAARNLPLFEEARLRQLRPLSAVPVVWFVACQPLANTAGAVMKGAKRDTSTNDIQRTERNLTLIPVSVLPRRFILLMLNITVSIPQ